MTVSGRNQPSLDGSWGPTIALTIVLTADCNAPRAQLIGPATAGGQPVKSIVMPSPSMVTATLTWIGSLLTPSPSMISVAV